MVSRSFVLFVLKLRGLGCVFGLWFYFMVGYLGLSFGFGLSRFVLKFMRDFGRDRFE